MPELERLLQKHRNRGVLIDSNLLLLLFIGNSNPARVGRYKRLQKYSLEDFALLVRLVEFFGRVVTTPNVLTEVSNLSGQLGEPARSEAFAYWKTEVEVLEERYIPSTQATSSLLFEKLGLTDSAIGLVAQAGCLILTEDFPLAQRLSSMGFDVLNFNHVRYYAWNT
jgi:hypothetical protein